MREIIALQTHRDEEVVSQLRERFVVDRYSRLLTLVLRQHQLKAGSAEQTTPDDDGLKLALAAWDWLNECTITSRVENVPPLCDLAKDDALIGRYRAARAARPATATFGECRAPESRLATEYWFLKSVAGHCR
jgi:hypothetical protein